MSKSKKTLAEEALAISEKCGRLKKRAREENEPEMAGFFQAAERGLEDAAAAHAELKRATVATSDDGETWATKGN